MTTFDYVIVGAGSAGCVLAARSRRIRTFGVPARGGQARFESSDPHAAGDRRAGSAAGLQLGVRDDAAAGPLGRRGYQPRGKTLGGSSSINAMVYIRGHRSDYDEWAALGNAGWSYDDVLPYFRRSENNERLADAITRTAGRSTSPIPARRTRFMDMWLAAAEALGFRASAISTVQSRKASAATSSRRGTANDGALRPPTSPQSRSPESRGADESHATRIVLDGRARLASSTGGAERARVRARREVIVSAGALQSPQLLLLSGIGERRELEPWASRRRGTSRASAPICATTSISCSRIGCVARTSSASCRATSSAREQRDALSPRAARDVHVEYRGRRRLRVVVCRSSAIPDLQLHFCIGILENHGRKLHA